MSQRYDHLWPQVTTFENLLLAWRKAARGKRSRLLDEIVARLYGVASAVLIE
jgi:hypothetical protein